ncbi:MAG: hypothetical protein ABIG44_04500 [Planctomycetota bacterium]
MPARIRIMVAVGGLMLAGLLGGCTTAMSMFDPEFLTALSGGSRVASIPGDAPALLVAVENGTDRLIAGSVSYRDGDGAVEVFSVTIQAGERTAQALICPIEEITLGDVSDTSATGAFVFLGATTNDPYIEVEPLGAVLKDGVNYDCGDAITFSIQRSSATRSGFRVYAYIQRAGGGG